MGPDPHGTRQDRAFAVMGDTFDLRMRFYMIFRVTADKTRNLVLVFVGAESTCGIYDRTAFFKALVSRLENGFLQRDTDFRTVIHIALDRARVSSEHPLSRARSIDKDLVEEQRKSGSYILRCLIKNNQALDA